MTCHGASAFLVNLQRLLDEELFVASYKFALLRALSDLSVEKSDATGAGLTLTTSEIAAQAVPYVAAARSSVLQKNTGQEADEMVPLTASWRTVLAGPG